MSKKQKRTTRLEVLRAAIRAPGANTPDRTQYRFAVDHLQPDAVLPPHRVIRRQSEDQVFRIAQSIAAFGFAVPIIVDRNMRIISGHAAWLAAKALGLETIPVARRDDLSDDEARYLALTLNRLAELSEWDEVAVANEFKYLLAVEPEMPFDLSITGFDAPEQDRFLALIEPPVTQQDDDPPADPGLPPCTRRNELWLMDQHRVLCADATRGESYAQLMDGDRAQMVLTDSPYNVPIRGHVSSKAGRAEFAMASGEMTRAEFTGFLRTIFTHLVTYSQEPSVHLLFMDHRHIVEMMTAGEAAYTRYLNLIIWLKANGGMGSPWRSRHELIFAWQNGAGSPINNVNLGATGRNRTTVWEAPGANSFGPGRGAELDAHPTPKPVSLLREAIKDVSHRNGIVLDPFLGGGATLIAAERTGRRCFGLEIDPGYVDATVRRWQRLTGREAIHAETGLTFAALAAARGAAPVAHGGVRLRQRPEAE